MTGHTDDVPHIQQLKELEGPLAHGIQLHVNLEPRTISLNVGKAGFPVEPQGQNATRRAYIYALAFQGRRIALGVSGHDLRGRGGLFEFMRVGIVAKSLHFGELFRALEVLVERLERQGDFPFVFHSQYTDGFLGASRKRLC